MSKTFKICFEIPEPILGTVVSLLSREVSHLQISEVEGTPRVNDTSKARNKTPISQTRAGRLLLDKVEIGQEFEYNELGPIMQSGGFKASSANSTVCGLTNEGFFERIGHGKYRRVR